MNGAWLSFFKKTFKNQLKMGKMKTFQKSHKKPSKQESSKTKLPKIFSFLASVLFFVSQSFSQTINVSNWTDFVSAYQNGPSLSINITADFLPSDFAGDIGSSFWGIPPQTINIGGGANGRVLDAGALYSGFAFDASSNRAIFENLTFSAFNSAFDLSDAWIGFRSSISFSANTGVPQGAALKLSNSSAVFTASDNLNRVSFLRNIASDSGGGIYLDNGSSVLIDGYSGGADFTLNGGLRVQISPDNISIYAETNTGGAIYAGSASSFTFNNSNVFFAANMSNTGGGAVYLDGAKIYFKHSQSSFAANVSNAGGALYAIGNAQITFDDSISVFSYNRGQSGPGKGAAIYAGNSRIEFINSEISFEYNEIEEGGAVYFDGGNTGKFENSTVLFTSNVAQKGGALAISGNVNQIDIINSTIVFERNSSASGEGGALYIANTASLFLLNSGSFSFLRNRASKGGAISVFNGSSGLNFEIAGAISINFTSNSAQFGGAVYLNSASRLLINSAKSAVFEWNTAQKGGAIYVSSGLLNISNNAPSNTLIFRDNKLFSGESNDIYLDSGSRLELNSSLGGQIRLESGIESFEGAIFIDVSRGEGVYLSGYNLFDNSSFDISGGSITRINLSTFIYQNSNNQLFNVNVATVIFSNSSVSFISNQADSSRSPIQNYGAMLFEKSTAVFVSNSVANGNGNGGVVSFLSAPLSPLMKFTESNASFISNSADMGGVAFLRAADSEMSFYNSTVSFILNSAVYFGGVAHLASINSLMSFDNSSISFISNSAPQGGVAYFINGIMSFYKSTALFTSNRADMGGVVAFSDYGNSELRFTESSASFISNRANELGGAIYIPDPSQSTFQFTASTAIFAFNNSLKTGGAVYALGGNVIFTGSSVSFTLNSANGTDTDANEGGGAIAGRGVNQTNFINSKVSFISNSASLGGAVNVLSDAKMDFTDSRSILFAENTADSAGGALYIKENALISFTNSSVSFIGNSSNFGGVASVSEGGQITFTQSSAFFISNTANNEGGVFQGAQIKFEHSTAVFTLNSAGNAGGVLSVGGQIDFEYSSISFILNKSIYQVGGVAYIYSDAILNFINSTVSFISNSSNLNNTEDLGGVIYVYGDSGSGGLLNISNSSITFLSNESSSGGAIVVSGQGASAFINGEVYFKSNKAIDGGAIYIDQGGSLTLNASSLNKDIIFQGNIADKGAAIYITGGILSMSGSSVNQAQVKLYDSIYGVLNSSINVFGLGIVRFSSYSYFQTVSSFGVINGARLQIENSTFVYTLNKEGGLYVSQASVTFENELVLFTTNTASIYGAAIYADTFSSIVFNRSQTVFSSNSAFNGGAIVAGNFSNLFFSNSSVSFTSNSAVNGGAIYARTFSNFSFSNSTVSFTSNSAVNGYGGALYASQSSFSFSNSTVSFKSNRASFGGAISAESSSKFSFANSSVSFTSNSASSNGGAIYARTFSNFSFSDSTVSFTSNSAAGYGGGAINASPQSSFTFANSTVSFTGNRIGIFGGAIYAVQSNFSFSKSTINFKSNSANNVGGAIFAQDNSAFAFSSSSVLFTSNSANNDGGAIYVVYSSFTLSDSTVSFTSNNTNGNGGAIYLTLSSASISGEAYFSNNSANRDGGAIYIQSRSSASISGEAYFSNNSANGYGGAIYAYGGGEINLKANTLDKNIIFQGNSAQIEGNAAYITSAIFSLSGSLEKNSKVIFYDSVYGVYSSSINIRDLGEVIFASYSYFRSVSSFGVIDGARLQIENSTFVYTLNKEGGLYVGQASVTFENELVLFTTNSSVSSGSALFADAQSSIVFNKSNIVFSSNSAVGTGRGGAIQISENGKVSFNNSKVFFTSNSAGGGAGVLNVVGVMSFYKSTAIFAGNMSLGHGGVSRGGGQILFSHSSAVFISNRSNSFGGVFRGLTIIFDFSTAIFVLNFAPVGGVFRGANAYFNDSLAVFSSNSATSNSGGGAFQHNDGNQIIFSFKNSTAIFTLNSAAGRGGAAAIDGGNSILSFDKSSVSFISNSVAQYGGALYGSSGSVKFTNLSKSFFIANTAASSGGAIFITSAVAGGNNIPYFGVIFDNSESSFISNSAGFVGGVSYITNFGSESFIKNSASTGGVVYMTDPASLMKFDNSQISFTSNSATVSSGGVAYIENGATFLSLKSSLSFVFNSVINNQGSVFYAKGGANIKFSSNSKVFIADNLINGSSNTGGSIYLSASTLSITGASYIEFTSNIALLYRQAGQVGGGAIVVTSQSKISLLDSSGSFVGNAALAVNMTGNSANGAAIFMRDGSVLDVQRSTLTFFKNSASYGAAIFFDEGALKIANFQNSQISFIENSAVVLPGYTVASDFRGGAIFVRSTSIAFDNSSVQFEGNISPTGGAIALAGAYFVGFTTSTADFSFNTAVYNPVRPNNSGFGGAIYAYSPGTTAFTDNSLIVFNRNVAATSGGAIADNPTGNAVALISFANSSAVFTFNSAVGDGLSYGAGGAIFANGIYSSFVFSNAGAEFGFNSAVLGGAIYASASAGIWFDYSEAYFSSNTAQIGAAIYIKEGATVAFNGGSVSFYGNQSLNSNGIIFWDNASYLIFNEVNRLDAVKNNALNGGFLAFEHIRYELGAIYYDISNNSAGIDGMGGDGGAFYADGGTFTIRSGGRIAHNTAAKSGGLIYAANKSSISIIADKGDIDFIGNKALAGYGDDIYLNDSILNFTANTGHKIIFEDGGIYAHAASTINAFGNGGEIYFGGDNYFAFLSSFGVIGNGVLGAKSANFVYTQNTSGIYLGGELNSFASSNPVFIIMNTEFLGYNNTNSDNSGSVFHSYRGSIKISSNSKFIIKDNIASNISNASGAAVYLTYSTLAFTGNSYIEFSSNITDMALGGDGGAIYAEYDSIVSFEGVRADFYGNLTQISGRGQGGAIYLREHSFMTISTSVLHFSYNSAGSGGAIFAGFSPQANNRINFNNSSVYFTSNSATIAGGAIAVENTSLSFTRASAYFSDNFAADFGGAAYFGDNLFFKTANSNIVFTSNSARLGGAIFASSSAKTMDFSLGRIDFYYNSAQEFGGAIFSNSAAEFRFTSGTAVFAQNSAIAGGAVYSSAAKFAFVNSEIRFTENTAKEGGAFFMENGNLRMADSTLLFSGNFASSGGAMVIRGQYTSIVAEERAVASLIFTSNTASSNGGALLIDNARAVAIGSHPVDLKTTEITAQNNTARYGGFAFINQSLVDFGDMQAISNNIAVQQGGALYITGDSELTIRNENSDILFENNTAIRGGAVYIEMSTFSLDAYQNVTFRQNVGTDLFDNKNDIYLGHAAVFTAAPHQGKIVSIESGIAGYDRTSIVNKRGLGILSFSGIISFDGIFNIREGEVQIKPLYADVETKLGTINLLKDYENAELTVMSEGWNMYELSARDFNIDSALNMSVNLAMGIHDVFVTTGVVNISSSMNSSSRLSMRVYGAIGKDVFELISSPYPVEGSFIYLRDYFADRAGGENHMFKTNLKLSYNDYGNGVYLEIDSRSDFKNNIPGLSHNQGEAASVFDGMRDGKKMPNIITALSLTSLEEWALKDGKFLETRALFDKLSGAFLVNAAAAASVDNTLGIYNKIREIDARDNKRKPTFIWMEGAIGSSKYDPEGYLGALKEESLSFRVGASLYKSANSLGGLYLSFGKDTMKQDLDEAKMQDIEAGIYGGWYGSGRLNFKGNASLGFHTVDTQRTIRYRDFEENPKSSFDSYGIKANIMGEYRIYAADEVDFKPFIELQNSLLSVNQARETGAPETALILEGGSYLRSMITGGIKFEDEKGPYKWYLKGYGGYSLVGAIPTYNIKFANGAGRMSDIEGRDLTVSAGIAFGAQYQITEAFHLFGDLDINAAIDYQAYSGAVGFIYKFGEQISPMDRDPNLLPPSINETARFEYRPMGAKTFRMLAAWFASGKYDLTPQSKQMIAEAAEDIKKFNYNRLVIEGHADSQGNETGNKTLSLMRARAVYEELYANGIPLEKMEYIEFFGSEQAVAPNDTEAGRARNRRAEIVIDYIIDEDSLNRMTFEENRDIRDRDLKRRSASGSFSNGVGEIMPLPDRTKKTTIYLDDKKNAVLRNVESGGALQGAEDGVSDMPADVSIGSNAGKTPAENREIKEIISPAPVIVEPSAPVSAPAKNSSARQLQKKDEPNYFDGIEIDIFDIENDAEI
jgi:predicted outer membrane repeat protein